MPRTADLLFLNGTVITLDPARPRVEGLAVVGERIAAVGAAAHLSAWKGENTHVVDLHGRAVIPGFIDAHAHLMRDAGLVDRLDLHGAPSREDVLARVRAAAGERPPGTWVVGRGWDESRWSERRYLTRAELDDVAPENPTLLTRIDGHMATANTAALEEGRLSGEVPGVETDEAGEPTGVLREMAVSALNQKVQPSVSYYARAFPTVQQRALALGITSVHDVVNDEQLRAYSEVRAAGNLRLRVYLMPIVGSLDVAERVGFKPGFGDAWLRLGALKVFADGSVGARTAALSRDYADAPGERGLLIHEEDALRELLGEASAAGFQLAVHAIGDRANALVADCLSDGQKRRHRIEHAEMPVDPKGLAASGLVASMQPNFVAQWGHPGGMYEARLGARYRRMNPFRRLHDAGVALAFGSDSMPMSPLEGIHAAVHAPYPEQRLTVEEALRAYTHGGAYASFEEGDKGSLRVGKLADLVVLSEDPTAAPDRVRELRVEMTVVGGQVAHSAA